MAVDDCVCVVFFAVLTTLLSEAISYVLGVVLYFLRNFAKFQKTLENHVKKSIARRTIRN